MLAEQVVQLVSAGFRLGEQMLVIQLIELAPGSGNTDTVERGGCVGVDAGAFDQAEPAEHPLRAGREVGVGHAERGSDRQILRMHEG
jgi:hypothetical protein